MNQEELKKSLEYSKTIKSDQKEVEEMLSSLKELDALFSVRKSLGSFDNSRDLIRDMKIDSILFYFDIIDNSITELLPKVEEFDKNNEKNGKSSKKSVRIESEASDTKEEKTRTEKHAGLQPEHDL